MFFVESSANANYFSYFFAGGRTVEPGARANACGAAPLGVRQIGNEGIPFVYFARNVADFAALERKGIT
jgi:hypothetical protein